VRQAKFEASAQAPYSPRENVSFSCRRFIRYEPKSDVQAQARPSVSLPFDSAPGPLLGRLCAGGVAVGGVEFFDQVGGGFGDVGAGAEHGLGARVE
jgi:hypothetical protein